MSNSIIDQQRDNVDFFWVQHSWLPGPVRPYDYDQSFRQMQIHGARLVYPRRGSGRTLKEVAKMLTGKPNQLPYYLSDQLEKACRHTEVAPRYSPGGLEGWFCNQCGKKL